MSRSNGNEHEMAAKRRTDDEQIEAILRGGSDDSPASFFEALRATGADAPDPEVAERHIAMAAEAARLSPDRLPLRDRIAHRSNTWRRRTVFTSFISTVLAKVLAASVALAAVAGGVGAVANSAAPGDPLYGIDTALERVHLFDGGAVERLQEAQRLADENRFAAALEHAGQALARADLMRSQAQAQSQELEHASLALREAAQAMSGDQAAEAPGYQNTEALREQVRAMLQQLAGQIEEDGHANGPAIAETAQQFRETALRLAEERKQEQFGPAPGRPPAELPVVTPVEPGPIVVPAPGEPVPIPVPTTMPTDTDGSMGGSGSGFMGGDDTGGDLGGGGSGSPQP